MMQPFTPTEFVNWKEQVKSQERVLPQVERINTRHNVASYSESGVHYQEDSHSEVSGHEDTVWDYYSEVHSDGGYFDRYFDTYTETANTNGYHDQYQDYYSDQMLSDSYSDFYTDQDEYDYYHQDVASTHTDVINHSDVGFDHNDFVPSTPRIYQINGATIPHVKGTLTIGFYSYDKNIDGFGSQDARSKTTYYDVKIRQVKDINGNAKVSAWKTLVNNSTVDTYNLNTVDPLGTGNINGVLTAGFYEIEVTARNATQTQRGVTQTYESTKLVKQIKIQQNQDPELRVSNYTSFLNFTFGNENVRTSSNQLYTYQNYATQYSLSKLNGLLVNIVVTEKDKDQYLKGIGWIETSAGAKIGGTEYNLVWENGETSIKTNGISDYTAQLFIPREVLKTLTSGGGYKIAVQIKDYLDVACTQSAGATLTQKTVSKTDLTQLVVGVDMVLPTVTFSTPDVNWKKSTSSNVKITDDYIGVDKWRYRILTDGVVTTSWSAYRTTTTENISITKSGRNKIEVEALDKAGNLVSSLSQEYKIDIIKPKIIINVGN